MTVAAHVLAVSQIPIARWVNDAVSWLLANVTPLFDFISNVVGGFNDHLDAWLGAVPVIVLAVIIVAFAWEAAGRWIAVFSAVALFLIHNQGLWLDTIHTVALTITSAVLALLVAEPVGIALGLSARTESWVRPVLDFMQTMPPYVYLIPAVLFFGLGPVPAVVSTIIFAIPPPVRLTALGFKQIPVELREVGAAFNCNRRQMLLKIELPTALPSILAGINQCIMMSLSMVIIASMIGAKGLGQDILYAISQVQVGAGFVSGLAVVFVAIILDRITGGVGNRAMQRGSVPRLLDAPLSAVYRLVAVRVSVAGGVSAVAPPEGRTAASPVPVDEEPPTVPVRELEAAPASEAGRPSTTGGGR